MYFLYQQTKRWLVERCLLWDDIPLTVFSFEALQNYTRAPCGTSTPSLNVRQSQEVLI